MTNEYVDVLIVGAGLSGVGAAAHLLRECPGKSFAIFESRGAIGGTWDLFRYPGIRSDSDMFTLGYDFRPWTDGKTIADGETIRQYVIDTADEYDITRRIRLNHRVVAAEWSSETARWSITALRTAPGEHPHGEHTGLETVTIECSWLSVCSGYYRYDEGFSPALPGLERFEGRVVHPQHWPESLDYEGKRVVVIGSGATAITLVPAMAETAEHVTMLQRSPSYVAARPSRDGFADRLRRRTPAKFAYSVVRAKNVLYSVGTYQLSRRRPQVMKRLLMKGAMAKLPADFDVAVHFGPRYNPWDQRLCVAADGDLFRAISRGRASIATDSIVRIRDHGIDLGSGAHLPADILVTATGLNLLAIGGIGLRVDGHDIVLSETLSYKGMMLSGVPNFSLTLGYTNASWTLKADLVAHYVCRLLRHMDKHGYETVTPVAPKLDPENTVALIDLQAGYIQRSVADLPRQGPSAPWRVYQNYLRDRRIMRRGSLTNGVRFGRVGSAGAARVVEVMGHGVPPRSAV